MVAELSLVKRAWSSLSTTYNIVGKAFVDRFPDSNLKLDYSTKDSMSRKGSGSKISPIAIDDSEDEVTQELLEVNRGPSPPRHPRTWPSTSRERPTQIRTSPNNMNVQMNNRREGGDTGGGQRPQKRKRANSKSHHDAPGPSQVRTSLEARFSGPSSKKARKRQRKLERQATDAESRMRHQTWTINHPLPEQSGRTPFETWTTNGLPYSSVPSMEPYSGEDAFLHPSPAILARYPFINPTYASNQTYSMNISNNSTPPTSDWVSSMAMAADEPLQTFAEPWKSYHSPWSLESIQTTIPFAGPSSTPPIMKGSQPRPLGATPIVVEPHTLPPKPPPPPASVPSIGMKPDQDPSSKHGLFQVPPPSQSQTDLTTGPYIPNPARTLVMEQLPKTHRNADFVNSWSKTACGAHPVYLAIDPPTGKALVEFATSELARKAWGSPRLGTAMVGMKPHQLKGRPREDLIKVWWYRVDGVGAGGGVGEIEEGEIEGDAGEKEVDVPVKKETKKERKARLAKERAEKQKKETPGKKIEENAPQTQPQPQPQPQPPSQPTPSTHPMPFLPQMVPPLPVHFPSSLNLYANGDLYGGQLAMPFPFTLPHAFHQPQLPQRGPLPPQSDLGPQWRGKDRTGKKKKDKTHYGASARQNATGGIVSDGSIASSRSPSPVAGASAIGSLSIKEGITDTHLGTQDPGDDMELDSPDSCRRPSFSMLHFSDHIETTKRDPSPPPSPLPPSVLPLAPPSSLPPRPPSPQPPCISGVPVPKVERPSEFNGDFMSTTLPPPTLSIATAVPPSSSHPSPHSPIVLSTPPPSTASPTLTATPPLAPSEPRAMKNAPKGPSYAKRSLLARHKDLEERITRSKMELGLLQTDSFTLLDPSSSLPTPPPSETARPEVDKLAMEERLRSLVLQSQRNKIKAVVSNTSSDSSPSPAVLSSSPGTSTPSMESTPAPISSIAAQSFSLDDLAVSFITETIQTYKAAPQPSPATIKLELAAKQKRLEQHIAESKILMAKLTQARTKQEKDAILAVMRQRSRMMEDESSTPSPPSNLEQPQAKAPASVKWPDSHQSTGIFIVSDDEDDDGSEGEDEDMA